jgi:hypothetical protein
VLSYAAIGEDFEMILTRKVALGVAGVAAAGVLGTAGVAAATSDNATPTAATASSAPSSGAATPADKAGKDGKDGRRHKIRRAVIARGMHGEWVVKGKNSKPVTLATIRGEVTAVSPTSVTVKAEDGVSETFAVNSDTKVKGADVTSISGVKVGAKGAMVGVKNGNTTTARVVLVRK